MEYCYGKLNENVRKQLISYIEEDKELSDWYPNPEQLSDGNLVCEILFESDVVYEGDYIKHRHWNSFERVVKVGEKYFSFDYASCTGDMGLEDIGWEFDLSSVIEVKPVEKVITTIEYKAV